MEKKKKSTQQWKGCQETKQIRMLGEDNATTCSLHRAVRTKGCTP